MSIIKVEKLKKVYLSEGTETTAVSDVSFDIKQGEFVAIMGPSGSGKSTLLHILGFLDRYSEGAYFFDGKEMSDYTESQLADVRNKKMGFVFQSFNLLARTSVLENVMLPLIYSNYPEKKWHDMALSAIEIVGLSHRLHHTPAQLSGGEKQRAAIARALVTKPQVIFADEPTGNLDSKSGQIVMETLQKLNEESGHTIILITHETYTAEHAERIIHIKDGMLFSDQKVKSRHHANQEFKK